MTALRLSDMPHYAATDSFQAAAALIKMQPDIRGVEVRNEKTIALYHLMEDMLRRKGTGKFFDSGNVETVRGTFAELIRPFGGLSPLIRLMHQRWNADEDYIGVYHTDALSWAVFLATVPTTKVAVQKDVPGKGSNDRYYSEEEILAMDSETIIVSVEPGSALILRSVEEDGVTVFHMIPRCEKGGERLCVLSYPNP